MWTFPACSRTYLSASTLQALPVFTVNILKDKWWLCNLDDSAKIMFLDVVIQLEPTGMNFLTLRLCICLLNLYCFTDKRVIDQSWRGTACRYVNHCTLAGGVKYSSPNLPELVAGVIVRVKSVLIRNVDITYRDDVKGDCVAVQSALEIIRFSNCHQGKLHYPNLSPGATYFGVMLIYSVVPQVTLFCWFRDRTDTNFIYQCIGREHVGVKRGNRTNWEKAGSRIWNSEKRIEKRV